MNSVGGVSQVALTSRMGFYISPPKQGDMYSGLLDYIANPKKLETGLRTSSAGIPYTLRLRIEAIGFPTFGLVLYVYKDFNIGPQGLQAATDVSGLW